MGVCSPGGFVAAGGHCGIKPDGAADLAVATTADGRSIPAAAVFTSNLATAAPVQVTRRHLEAAAGHAAAVVLNSGNANAATGKQGLVDAERMCELAATSLGCDTQDVLVCSTGLIGIPLPMAPLETGIPRLVAARSVAGGTEAADAILTTDTVRKEVVVGGEGFVVGGMAKGAAMLAPNMATMLAVLTTDADIGPGRLQTLLADAVNDSFNALSVDGCTSTNDTVIVLASGAAGIVDEGALAAALREACTDLALQMAEDAEGATKVARVRVVGASSVEEAQRAARKVAESQLVKCSLFGADPYWGRIVSELGSAGVGFDPDLVEIAYGGVVVAASGVSVDHDSDAVSSHLMQRHVELTANLGLGQHEATIITNDLTPAYIDENMRTS
jgi:glutamate N-acetyltransferase/amino-acid N-acetyltransferase